MMFWTDLDRAYDEVHDARAAVDKAQRDYSKGGSANAVNSANRRLADAHDRLREINGGRVRDTR
ncbi:hypothetical protein NLM31_21025 [Bradyrhizobium sp. CCGUVB4N]|uniref:hypothetical protein n=1 Tax=Bradyrhizobium sp. CCGUVB4N TaxID=2949631 RepID=UPI0020B2E4F5|nr:hypothetical protein [Bradyrhizobium sp. CCGUVB4N]MCP3382853.1 hypothetical protein [Bradyrhizobium sp. CCGUVB4N]